MVVEALFFLKEKKTIYYLVHCADYIASEYFIYVGKMIAHSVLHSGKGFVGLSRAISEFIVTNDLERSMLKLIVNDIPDLDIRESLAKQLVKNGKIAATVHKVSLTADITKKLYEKHELVDVDTQSPRALLQTVWFQISIYFGKRGRENQSSLKKSMLCLVKTADGQEYFELNRSEPGAVLTSKNHTGGLDGSEDHSDGKIFSQRGSKRCPVEILKTYLNHLNPNISALFQRPKSESSAKFNPKVHEVWYDALSSNIETQQIKAITGHKSDSSIESYCERPTLGQFKEMSTALTSFIHSDRSPESRSQSLDLSKEKHGHSATILTPISTPSSCQNLQSTEHENFFTSLGLNSRSILPSGSFNNCQFTFNIQDAQKNEDLDLTPNELLMLTEAAFVNELVTIENKYRACQCVMTHVVFQMRKDEIDQLRRGMDCISLLTFLKSNEGCLPFIFPLTGDVKISVDELLQLIPQYSPDMGDNEKVINWLIKYVKDVGERRKGEKEGILSALPSLEEMVQFLVGHPYLPTKQLCISFAPTPFPDPNACFMSVKLPNMYTNYEDFKHAMNVAITAQHSGFGRG
ncbi:E3 ubiquitin- ligase UPL2-like [Paramuricea clavata]|uniref:E3 ubiquitin- ligase UPL2-like n=1 Tax=Paramuricea clavata TaxID=317549 RepID=A0A6S7J3Q9_PARCT|nr:E3 ubiquitin- ligase UPL2-like [Paramuricea clavata]